MARGLSYLLVDVYSDDFFCDGLVVCFAVAGLEDVLGFFGATLIGGLMSLL